MSALWVLVESSVMGISKKKARTGVNRAGD
jgi:hypothetical protein